MEQLTVNPIGTVRQGKDGALIQLFPQFSPALLELDGFSHIIITWWFSGCDDPASRKRVLVPKPYRDGPELMGTFATRSPERPNPIAISTTRLLSIDHAAATLRLAYFDADDGTPVLDVKPYTPSLDRVDKPIVPGWCARWPRSYERSGEFDWESVFQYD